MSRAAPTTVSRPATREPRASEQPGEGAARRWLRRALFASGLVLLVVGALGTAAPLLVRFERPVTPSISGAENATVPGFDGVGAHVVGYEHHGYVDVVVPLVNEGPLPVLVTGVELTQEPSPLVTTVETDLPGMLAPGERGAVVIRGRFDNCRYYHERELQSYEAVTVRSRVAGIAPASTVLPLDLPVLVHSPMVVDCPDRTLDRGDDVRGR